MPAALSLKKMCFECPVAQFGISKHSIVCITEQHVSSMGEVRHVGWGESPHPFPLKKCGNKNNMYVDQSLVCVLRVTSPHKKK